LERGTLTAPPLDPPGASQFGNLKSAVEIVGGITAVLVTVGYAPLRARLNFLGIAGVTDIQTEQYLFEAFKYLWVTLVSCIVLGVVGLIVWASAMIVVRILRLRRSEVRLVHKSLLFRAVRWATRTAAVLPPVVAGVLFIMLMTNGNIFQVAVLTGLISPDTGVFQQPLLFPLVVVSSVLLGFWLASPGAMAKLLEFVPTPLMRWIRLLSIALIAGLFAMSQFVFSTQYEPLEFPEVSLSDQKTITCGLLVFATSKDYYLWNLEKHSSGVFGAIVKRPRTPESVLQIGPLRDIPRLALGKTGEGFCSPTTGYGAPMTKNAAQ
jgi:hypothetical protein